MLRVRTRMAHSAHGASRVGWEEACMCVACGGTQLRGQAGASGWIGEGGGGAFGCVGAARHREEGSHHARGGGRSNTGGTVTRPSRQMRGRRRGRSAARLFARHARARRAAGAWASRCERPAPRGAAGALASGWVRGGDNKLYLFISGAALRQTCPAQVEGSMRQHRQGGGGAFRWGAFRALCVRAGGGWQGGCVRPALTG